MMLLPPSIEEYVKPEDPVRAYDAFVESLNFEELGIRFEPEKAGRPNYDPKAMLKLYLYGCSYGWRSSRKLERAIHHNLSFIWLMGGLKPDHKTISEFRRKNKATLKRVFKQCAHLCVKLGLIEGNTLFVDGTKIRANASIKNTWDNKRCQRALSDIDSRIEEILSECEKTDIKEENRQSLVKMREELKDKETLKAKVEQILKELNGTDKKTINATDADCGRMSSIHGIHCSYNVQKVVDEKHGLIVNTDVVSENNDLKQFAKQIKQANEILDKKCQTACADAGYANTDELEKIDKQNIKVIVPTKEQVSKKESKPFSKKQFQYDFETDSYTCPQGQQLIYRHTQKDKGNRVYRIREQSICRQCRFYRDCTNSRDGRTIYRLPNEEIKHKLEQQYNTDESQQIYHLRKCKVELPFGHIKRNLGVSSFLTRGLQGVNAELSILACCFNITRMITIFKGAPALITKLTG
ncbi:MAG: IS1182 family transposase [Candidatus Omnitrophota bacterium]